VTLVSLVHQAFLATGVSLVTPPAGSCRASGMPRWEAAGFSIYTPLDGPLRLVSRRGGLIPGQGKRRTYRVSRTGRELTDPTDARNPLIWAACRTATGGTSAAATCRDMSVNPLTPRGRRSRS
jgi:hypothetical protein